VADYLRYWSKHLLAIGSQS